MMRFSKFRRALIRGEAFFFGVAWIFGVWLRTLPALESDPWVGMFSHIRGGYRVGFF
jgi:hypothetical protein